MSIARKLFTAAGVRELDRRAIATGIPGSILMERAGAFAFAELRRRWPDITQVSIVAGSGNNAGDGFVVARLAHAAGMVVQVHCVAGIDRFQGDASTAFNAMLDAGVSAEGGLPDKAQLVGVVVDAMFGTGLDRPLSASFASAVDAINESGLPVLALDIPSGLNADTGNVLGCSVRANATVTFVALKQGLFTGDGPDYCGDLAYTNLELPADLYSTVAPGAELVDRCELLRWLPRRRRNAHKGHFGHVLVVGGDYGYAGAVRMCAEAAARVGSGLVSVATRAGHAHVIGMSVPEVMCHAVESLQELAPLLTRASVVAVGPGLGQSAWAQSLFEGIASSELPMVVDADALTLLARTPQLNNRWVLTPHPGEAGKLLDESSAAVQENRFAAVLALQKKYGGICLLKGCGTLIKDAVSPPQLCHEGNPGMASGGMGDVLTGVIAGLLAQGIPPASATALGVAVHAAAADKAALAGERGLLARDVIGRLREQVNDAAGRHVSGS